MRYLAVGAATALATAVLTAAFFIVFVDRSQQESDPNKTTLMWVANEAILQGTLVTRNDLYRVVAVPQLYLEDRAMQYPPVVGQVATVNIKPGDQLTIGDFEG